MPALPEIEVIRRDLEREVVGRRFKEIEVRPGSNAMKVIRRHGRRKEFHDLLVGARVEGVERRGKWILMELDNDHVLAVDLGEAGALVKCSASEGMASHTHIVLGFTIGGQLRVIDPKRTGEVFVAPTEQVARLPELQVAAIDPLDQNPLTWQHFSTMLAQRAQTMKGLLMDEHFVVGLGHIYSDEVLFAAGLRFDRVSNKLSSQDVRRLYRSLVETLQDAVRARGTTWGGDDGFRDLQGHPGTFQLELKVFDRDGEPCRRCRHQIEKAFWDGRYTYFCPQCQS
jgi:formamidopyrimidine-DNA glycosylase